MDRFESNISKDRQRIWIYKKTRYLIGSMPGDVGDYAENEMGASGTRTGINICPYRFSYLE